MKRVLSFVLALLMLATLAACSGNATSSSVSEETSSASESEETSESSSESVSESSSEETAELGRWDALKTTDEQVKLLVDLQNSNPTVNTEPTEEAPRVQQAAAQIAADWLSDKPNVSLEWSYANSWGDYEWFTLQVSAHTCPDIVSGFSSYSNEDWFLPLNDVYESANYYEPGNTRWMDMWPDYLTAQLADANGNIFNIFHTVYPGPATVYYYNVDLFNKLGLEQTNDWDTFVSALSGVKEQGYTAFASGSVLSCACWPMQFSFGPYYAEYFRDQWDLDGDGSLSMREVVYYNYTGLFSMQQNEAMYEMWSCIRDMYAALCDDGYKDIDYTADWQNGNVLIKEDGIWYYPNALSDTSIDFEVGMMVPPIKQNSEYLSEIEYTEAGPYQPMVEETINVMKAEWQEKDAIYEDYCVDFLKYVHTTDNLSIIIEERDGSGIGAIKGCRVPASLSDWLSKSFPIKPTGIIMSYCTPDGEQKLNALLEEWVTGLCTEEEFRARWDEIVTEDAVAYMEQNEVEDTGDWVKFDYTLGA